MGQELTALSLRSEINANHRECLRAGNEAIQHAYQAGELLTLAKSLLKAEKTTTFGDWCNQFLDFSDRTARGYVSLYHDLEKLPKRKRVSVLDTAESVSSLRKLITLDAKPAGVPGHGEQKSHQANESCDADPSADSVATLPDDFGDDSAPKPPTKPPRKLDRKAYYKQWDQSIGPLIRLVDAIGKGVGEHNGVKQQRVLRCLGEATDAMEKWMEVGA